MVTMGSARITGVMIRDYLPKHEAIEYHLLCHECNLSMFFGDKRIRDMMVDLHTEAYLHDVIRAKLVEEPWTPFNQDGSLRDLVTEGWHHLGRLKDGEGPVITR